MAKDEKLAEKETKVKFSDKVKIEATENSIRLKKGKVYEVHPIQAEKLVKAGKAIYKK